MVARSAPPPPPPPPPIRWDERTAPTLFTVMVHALERILRKREVR
ncbi:MAG: hypothetical protein ACT6TH_15385 [Brevundimonas sp.]